MVYLGHLVGSLPCAPTRVAGYLVVPENHAYEDGRWRVLELEPGGPGVKLKQTVPVKGWTWASPPTAGSVIWSVSDRGEVAAYAIGASTDRQPLQKIAELPADAAPSGPAFGSVRTDRELWTSFASRINRLDLSPERGRIQAGWSIVEAGPAVAGIQRVGRLAVMTQRGANGTGVAIWAWIRPRAPSVADLAGKWLAGGTVRVVIGIGTGSARLCEANPSRFPRRPSRWRICTAGSAPVDVTWPACLGPMSGFKSRRAACSRRARVRIGSWR